MAKHFSEKQLTQAQSKQFQIVDQTTLCVECLDHRAALKCQQCDDQYCDLCFAQLHRFGFRALHKFTLLQGHDIHTAHLNDAAATTTAATTTSNTAQFQATTTTSSTTTTPAVSLPSTQISPVPTTLHSVNDIPEDIRKILIIYPSLQYRLRFIPIRLSEYERKLLHLLESALNISEYTDKVDTLQNRGRDNLIVEQISSIYGIISALYLSGEFKKGVRKFLTQGKNSYYDNRIFFQHIMEVGRRHKIRNPDKLRSGYGKLMAIVADSKLASNRFGFDLCVPVRSLHTRCEQWGISELLNDPLLEIATAQVDVAQCNAANNTNNDTNKQILKNALEVRNIATKSLITKYSTIATSYISTKSKEQLQNTLWYDDDDIISKKIITQDHIRELIASITDAHNYLYQCFTPLTKMQQRLERWFAPTQQVLPIDIRNGVDGSRLSHSTTMQYAYIHQTFYLWRLIVLRMYPLWYSADCDLLNGYSTFNHEYNQIVTNPINYQLRFTEQGITRMQSCPNVGKNMSDIMSLCFRHFSQDNVNNNNQYTNCGWVGSSAVHLGDTNVPNSLSFIDKYTQLERILAPLDRTLRQIEIAWDDKTHQLHSYVHQYTTALSQKTKHILNDENNNDNTTNNTTMKDTTPLHHLILQDYFRHAFNGSGADNYNSAGSCIDGRLTSSWEWCNIISKKEYHQAFLITGFVGWDG